MRGEQAMCFCVMSVTGKPKSREYSKFGLEIRRMRCGTRLNLQARDDLRKNSLRNLTNSQLHEVYSQGCGKKYSNLEFKDIYTLAL